MAGGCGNDVRGLGNPSGMRGEGSERAKCCGVVRSSRGADGTRELAIELPFSVLFDLLFLQDTDVLIEGCDLFGKMGDFAFKVFLDVSTAVHLSPVDGLESLLVGFHGRQGALDGFLFRGDPFLARLRVSVDTGDAGGDRSGFSGRLQSSVLGGGHGCGSYFWGSH